MSKLFNKYKLLKTQDNSKLYLFKSGIFYLFIDEDAKIISNLFGLKLTNLNEQVKKCGFPLSQLSKYTNLFTQNNIEFQIIDENLNSVNLQKEYIQNSNVVYIIETIQNLKLDNITPMQAFNLIKIFQERLINDRKHIINSLLLLDNLERSETNER